EGRQDSGVEGGKLERPHTGPWRDLSVRYRHLISDPTRDSWYLRWRGLEETLRNMTGDCSKSTLLDVASGTGWIGSSLKPYRAFECDIAVPAGADETR